MARLDNETALSWSTAHGAGPRVRIAFYFAVAFAVAAGVIDVATTCHVSALRVHT